jgi:hypothetical protein
MPGRKQTAHGPTFGAIASLLFRMAMTLGVYDLYMRRQRYLHTVVTNLHGPERPLTFCGAPVVEMLPWRSASAATWPRRSPHSPTPGRSS